MADEIYMDFGDGSNSTPVVVRDEHSAEQYAEQTQSTETVSGEEPIVINAPPPQKMPGDDEKAPKRGDETVLEYYFGDLADDIVFIAVFILFNMRFVTQLIAPLVPVISIGGEPSFLSVLVRAILARLAVHGIHYLLKAIS